LGNQIDRIKDRLKAEKKEHGAIFDRSGDRYYLFYLHFLLDDGKRSKAYIRWYRDQFPDDMGEPFQLLCWALIAHRNEDENTDLLLAKTMLGNLYLLPRLIGRPIGRTTIWHAITFAEPEYVDTIPPRILEAITDEEIEWIAGRYESPLFTDLRDRYIEIETRLKTLEPGEERSRLVDESHHLIDGFCDRTEQ
jgi:hypothetical protein